METKRYSGNWLTTLLDYTKKQESPEKFHIWSGLSVISAALGRRCWLHRGYAPVFPNQYIILVGESALCRKTTAANISVDMFKRTKKDLMIEKLTPAYLCQHLAECGKADTFGDSATYIYSPELSNLIGMGAYQSGLVSLLTTLYDCPSEMESRTKGAGVDIIRNACLNILGATTMDWMSSSLPGDTVEGGFTGRVIFGVGEEPKEKNAWLVLTREEMQLRELLTHDLMIISTLRGEFKVTDEARDFYEEWYMKENNSDEDMRLLPYYGRKGTHVLKVAMAFAVAESNDLVIDVLHIDSALNALKSAEENMTYAFRGVAFSKVAKDTDRILRQIEKAGGQMEHAILLKNNYCFLSAKEFEEVMRTLQESNLVQQVLMAGGKRIYNTIKRKKEEV